MRKLPVQEEKIRRAIRDIVAIDPLISVSKLQVALMDRGYKSAHNDVLHWHYVSKLKGKIRRQAIEEVNRQEVVERVSEMKERFRLIFEQLIRIAFYSDDMKKEGMPPPNYRDRIAALREIARLDKGIFEAELDSGIFERHIGTMEVEKRNQPLPAEMKAQMIKAFENWGIVPRDVIPYEQPTATIESKDTGMVEQ